ncbi:Transport ATP-binding protein CydC [Leucobacter sp. 7(1)]|uniref:thiol reductant ABC exporter subunit CydC n=1 Tax=Leucobacter sp. 7(1) TaxID=1255613 RepID=UPI00097E8493|nr:thiol reductant ABC exporter subunit CydC [Leucobacter sp. 7(1)]SJN12491.1 Transport ATP-binding protein CydC [Leucobacter sp. 7(1)]
MNSDPRQTRDTPDARRAVLERAMPSRQRRFPGLAFGMLADACVVALLGLSMWLIVRAGEQPPILHLTFAIVGVRALAIGRAAFRYTERLFSHDAALAQLATLRADTFSALIPRVPGAIESHRRGEVLAAFVDDVDQLQDEPLRVRQPLLVSAVVVGLSIVVVALISPSAAAVLTVVLGLSGALAVALAQRSAGASDRELSAARAGLVDALLERFAASEVLAAFGAVGEQRERITAAEARLSTVQLRRARSAGVTGAILAAASGIASVATLLVLLPALSDGLSAPLFAAAVVVPAAVFEVFAQVPTALAARRAVQSSADRVAQLTEGELAPEIPRDRSEQASDPAHTRGGSGNPAAPLIEVSELAVRHPGASRDAVRGLSFALQAGETLVVTGESGAGKSTVALALVRFLNYRGSYRLRGVEVTDLPIAEVRRTVGLCEQLPHLFNADLRQNLKFARDTATDEELMAALDRVGLGEWARSRGGLDAAVGEHGGLVSGGQAQRIALARALLADFPVVVLDEPTAGVDRELADRLLTDLVGAVPADRAVVLITHTELPAGIDAARLELVAPAAG